MSHFKNILKKNKIINFIYSFFNKNWAVLKMETNLFKNLSLLLKFYKNFYNYKKINTSSGFSLNLNNIYPCVFDNSSYTPLDPIYFFQDSWAANKIFNIKPEHHYDIGSSAKTIGILSQFVPITMVDIRPIRLSLKNLFFKQGSILNLPFKNNSIKSLSSLCVIEHIGLGRYGDKVDPYGSEKAIKELKRILAVGGIILFSIPIDNENKIYFNAHRAFTRNYIIELFDEFKIIEEKYIYGTKIYDSYNTEEGFGTGLYMLKKIK